MTTNDDERRNALIELGAEALADVILELAFLTDEADQTVERIVSDDSANIARLEERIANCIYDEEADIAGPVVFIQRLEFLLHDLGLSVHDSFEGFRLTSLFIENDHHVFNNVSDDGTFSRIFQNDAVELLVHYGSGCNDKEWLCHQLFCLYDEDLIGSRWNVFAGAAEYIPEEKIRMLIERMQSVVASNPDERGKWSQALESLAIQIKDFDLLEHTRLAGSSTLSTADICEIARLRLDAGDASGALGLLKKVDAGRNRQTEFNKLLLAVYKVLEMKDEETAQAWKLFKSARSEENFEALLQAIGENERESVIDGEISEIFAPHGVTYSDAHFLLNGKRFDDAEKYLWKHVVPLKRGLYANILPLAQAMEQIERHLMASFLYRVVLDELLQQGYSKSYHHGVGYLRKLDAMSEKISDWKDMVPHADYLSNLRTAHRMKGSFWSKYGGILG